MEVYLIFTFIIMVECEEGFSFEWKPGRRYINPFAQGKLFNGLRGVLRVFQPHLHTKVWAHAFL